jgi:cytidylate kinase
MSKKIIITIDGWSSCGKSTLAKQLARELGYVYVDSGAMYRAITLYF